MPMSEASSVRGQCARDGGGGGGGGGDAVAVPAAPAAAAAAGAAVVDVVVHSDDERPLSDDRLSSPADDSNKGETFPSSSCRRRVQYLHTVSWASARTRGTKVCRKL